MKTLLLLLVVVVKLTAGRKPITPAKKDFFEIEREVLELFDGLDEPNITLEQDTVDESYDIEANIKRYRSPQVVKKFMKAYKSYPVKSGNLSSADYDKFIHLAMKLAELLYTAKNYGTFYKTAVWARKHMNEAIFLYGFSVAVKLRHDTKEIILPPLYEVYPTYYEPIKDAFNLTMK